MREHRDPDWLAGAFLVCVEHLELASGDAPYILDGDDIEEACAWIVADIPIAEVQRGFCRESAYDREVRLGLIRKVPPGQLFRPIAHGSEDGTLRLIDGGHRMDVAKERGQTVISALVKLDFIPEFCEIEPYDSVVNRPQRS